MDEASAPLDRELLEAWADFRYRMRAWNSLSEQASREVGLAPQHQQVLLAIKGYKGGEPPRIIDLAERMQLQHHSMVGLLDRMQHEGLVVRETRSDGRGVSVLITDEGDRKLAAALLILRPQLPAAATTLIAALSQLVGQEADHSPPKVEVHSSPR